MGQVCEDIYADNPHYPTPSQKEKTRTEEQQNGTQAKVHDRVKHVAFISGLLSPKMRLLNEVVVGEHVKEDANADEDGTTLHEQQLSNVWDGQ